MKCYIFISSIVFILVYGYEVESLSILSRRPTTTTTKKPLQKATNGLGTALSNLLGLGSSRTTKTTPDPEPEVTSLQNSLNQLNRILSTQSDKGKTVPTTTFAPLFIQPVLIPTSSNDEKPIEEIRKKIEVRQDVLPPIDGKVNESRLQSTVVESNSKPEGSPTTVVIDATQKSSKLLSTKPEIASEITSSGKRPEQAVPNTESEQHDQKPVNVKELQDSLQEAPVATSKAESLHTNPVFDVVQELLKLPQEPLKLLASKSEENQIVGDITKTLDQPVKPLMLEELPNVVQQELSSLSDRQVSTLQEEKLQVKPSDLDESRVGRDIPKPSEQSIIPLKLDDLTANRDFSPTQTTNDKPISTSDNISQVVDDTEIVHKLEEKNVELQDQGKSETASNYDAGDVHTVPLINNKSQTTSDISNIVETLVKPLTSIELPSIAGLPSKEKAEQNHEEVTHQDNVPQVSVSEHILQNEEHQNEESRQDIINDSLNAEPVESPIPSIVSENQDLLGLPQQEVLKQPIHPSSEVDALPPERIIDDTDQSDEQQALKNGGLQDQFTSEIKSEELPGLEKLSVQEDIQQSEGQQGKNEGIPEDDLKVSSPKPEENPVSGIPKTVEESIDPAVLEDLSDQTHSPSQVSSEPNVESVIPSLPNASNDLQIDSHIKRTDLKERDSSVVENEKPKDVLPSTTPEVTRIPLLGSALEYVVTTEPNGRKPSEISLSIRMPERCVSETTQSFAALVYALPLIPGLGELIIHILAVFSALLTSISSKMGTSLTELVSKTPALDSFVNFLFALPGITPEVKNRIVASSSGSFELLSKFELNGNGGLTEMLNFVFSFVDNLLQSIPNLLTGVPLAYVLNALPNFIGTFEKILPNLRIGSSGLHYAAVSNIFSQGYLFDNYMSRAVNFYNIMASPFVRMRDNQINLVKIVFG